MIDYLGGHPFEIDENLLLINRSYKGCIRTELI